MRSQVLVIYLPIAVLANVLITALYGLQMPLAPAAMLNDLENALDAFLPNSPNWYAARGPYLVEAWGSVFAVVGAGLRGRDWSRECMDRALGMCHPASGGVAG
jgi:hypothetical protein